MTGREEATGGATMAQGVVVMGVEQTNNDAASNTIVHLTLVSLPHDGVNARQRQHPLLVEAVNQTHTPHSEARCSSLARVGVPQLGVRVTGHVRRFLPVAARFLAVAVAVEVVMVVVVVEVRHPPSVAAQLRLAARRRPLRLSLHPLRRWRTTVDHRQLLRSSMRWLLI